MTWLQNVKKDVKDNFNNMRGLIAHYEILFYSIPFALSIGWVTNWIYNQYLIGKTISNALPALTINNSNFSDSEFNLPIIYFLTSVFFIMGLIFYYKAYKNKKSEVDEYERKSIKFKNFIYLPSMALLLAVTLSWTGSITETLMRQAILQQSIWIPTVFIIYLAAIAFVQLTVYKLKVVVIAIILISTLMNTLYHQSELSLFYFYLATLVVTSLLIVDTYKKYLFPKNLLTETDVSRECHHLIMSLSNWSLYPDIKVGSSNEKIEPKMDDGFYSIVNKKHLNKLKSQLTEHPILLQGIEIKQYDAFYAKQFNENPEDSFYLALFTEMIISMAKKEYTKNFEKLINILNGVKQQSFNQKNAINSSLIYSKNMATENEYILCPPQEPYIYINKVRSITTFDKLILITNDFAKHYQLNNIIPFSAWYIFIGKFINIKPYNNWEMSTISIDYFISPSTKGKRDKLKQISVLLSSNTGIDRIGSYSAKDNFIDLLNHQFSYYDIDIDVDFYWIERKTMVSEKNKMQEQTKVIRQSLTDEYENDKLNDLKCGVDFNSFYDVSYVIASILKEHEKTYKERFTTLDFTGGQKITSTVMSFYATTTKIKNQVVDTNDYSVIGYDFVYQDITHY